MNIILDFDGTIHDCAKIFVPAIRMGTDYLIENGLMEKREFTDEEIISYLGYSPKAMWEHFAPELESSIKEKVSRMISDEMDRLTLEGRSVLFDGADKALEQLKKNGHTLIFLSNCFHGYMEMHRKVHGLDRFYSAYYCSEDFGYISKPEIFEQFKDKYKGSFAVVGDRYLDLETAWKHDLLSVGCTYGYCEEHELDKADILISDISELPSAIEKLVTKTTGEL